MKESSYCGSELELFAGATRWKSYLRAKTAPYLGPEVLEVGAGIGGTTKALCHGRHDRWVCLEPDGQLAAQILQQVRDGRLPPCCRPVAGTTAELAEEPPFDTILYIDVLEHVEDDKSELTRAAGCLKSGGYLLVLAPAHQWLYTPFDQAIGHYRRYSKGTLSSLTPHPLRLVRSIYLDSVGMLASLGNRLLLKRGMPSHRQIAVWDRLMVPLSRVVDVASGHRLGKSVMAVWQK